MVCSLQQKQINDARCISWLLINSWRPGDIESKHVTRLKLSLAVTFLLCSCCRFHFTVRPGRSDCHMVVLSGPHLLKVTSYYKNKTIKMLTGCKPCAVSGQVFYFMVSKALKCWDHCHIENKGTIPKIHIWEGSTGHWFPIGNSGIVI